MDAVSKFQKLDSLVSPRVDDENQGVTTPDARDGSKDRVALLKERITVAGGVDSNEDVTVQFAMLSEKQDKDMEKVLVDGEEESTSASITNQTEEADGDDEDEGENKNVGAKPQDPLGLAKLGYTKEQVDGWLAQGYSISDIKNGVAASGEKNTEIPNQIAEPA